MKTFDELPDLLTPQQFAEYIRLNPLIIKRWIKQGKIESIKEPHGKRIDNKISKEYLKKFIDGNLGNYIT